MCIGYACMTVGVLDTDLKTCTKKNAVPDRLTAIISHNLHSLENMLQYNHENRISLFRISSDLIPFGSSEVNNLPWWSLFQETFQTIGSMIRDYQIRVSMHPGQYTVLNSPNKEVVDRAILDLEYHAKVLDCLGTDSECKIILHIGGIYGNKKQAVANFLNHFQYLPSSIRNRLAIENDDRSFTIEDVVEIGSKIDIPVVFDVFHHLVHHTGSSLDLEKWIRRCATTWQPKDGLQKIHYSQQALMKKPGSHSTTIRVADFLDFYPLAKKTDIMLEVKDKNLSAVKCILCTSPVTKIQHLEKEWSRYKYLVLEASPAIYHQIRSLLQDKKAPDTIGFYTLLEQALSLKKTLSQSINAAEHIWGYFSGIASEKEKTAFLRAISLFRNQAKPISSVKRILWKLTDQYQQPYLLDSYYFLDLWSI